MYADTKLVVQNRPLVSPQRHRMKAGFLLVALCALPTLSAHADWTPSKEQVKSARSTISNFLTAIDRRNYARAYGMMTGTFRANVSLEQFQENATRVGTELGGVVERRQVKTTWYLNPQNADAPGTYVAVDLRAKFQNSDRYCGYVALLLKPNGAFDVVRQEQNYLTRNNEQALKREKGPAAVEAAWAKLSQYCPN